MKFSLSDLLLMQRSIAAVCLASLLSAAILYITAEYAEHAQDSRHNAQNQLNDARNRLLTALQDQENMAIYAGEYATLLEQQIIGEEQRLDWIEGLEKIRQRDLVTDFRYNIAPQKTYVSPLPIDGGNFDIRYSEMKLQLDLLHEAQLLDFFDALRTGIKGRYLLDGCTLQRTGSEGETSARNKLRAECSGGWITLKNRNTP